MPVDSDAYYSLAVAETAAVVLHREQYSETISENPASQDAEKRPGDGSPGAAAAANAN
jgi:hypothetical protein